MSETDKFALIVPYRNRAHNLVQLVLNLQWYLDPRSFDIFIVEQADSLPFNRGCTLNVGFDLARKHARYSHYVLHDVDLIPLRADYSRPDCAVHLSAATGQFLYELPYEESFGGVVLFTQGDFELVNGFSNHYWGWGREDYDLYLRCGKAGLRIERRPGRYISMPHAVSPELESAWVKNQQQFIALQDRDFREDGLNSLDYDLIASCELAELPFVEKRRPLPSPIQWASVKVRSTAVVAA
jgi:hypothetical protein